MMIPWDVTLIPVYLPVRSLGLIDTYWARIIANLMALFGIFLLRQICVDLPNEQNDAAHVDSVSTGHLVAPCRAPCGCRPDNGGVLRFSSCL